jgi:hypothetical protein
MPKKNSVRGGPDEGEAGGDEGTVDQAVERGVVRPTTTVAGPERQITTGLRRRESGFIPQGKHTDVVLYPYSTGPVQHRPDSL